MERQDTQKAEMCEMALPMLKNNLRLAKSCDATIQRDIFMFFNRDILIVIMSKLDLVDRTKARAVSMEWKKAAEAVDDTDNWKEYLEEKNLSHPYLDQFGNSYKNIFHNELNKLLEKIPELKIKVLEVIKINLVQVDWLNKFSESKLKILLSDNGLNALREELITQEQAMEVSDNVLSLILSDDGIVALREGLVTVDQAKKLVEKYLKLTLTDLELASLRKFPIDDQSLHIDLRPKSG